MVTNSSRILHLIALVIGETQTQLQSQNPQILGNDWELIQVLLRCPFLDESTIDRESGSQQCALNCVEGREEDKNTQIMGANTWPSNLR